MNTYSHFYLKKPSKIEKILNNYGFKNYKIISSAKIWSSLKNKEVINLKSKDIKNPKIYNIIFTKKQKINIDKKIFNKIKDEKINYYQDNDLLNDLKFYENLKNK